MASRGRSRGGYQRPAQPAAASGPGALAQRTDAGPADKQPIRAVPGGTYGDRQASVEQQRVAPLRAGGPNTPPPQPQPDAAAPPVPAPEDVWRGTDRPAEPLTAGARLGAGPGPDDPMLDIRASAAALLQAVADSDPRAADELLGLLEELDGA